MKKKHYKIFNYIVPLILILIIIYIINGINLERYHQYYPTINIYPDNFNEVKIVQQYVRKKNLEIDNFIKLTDKSVTYAFENIVVESKEELINIETCIVPFIMFFKLLFNRARPKQINNNLDVFESISANTPAFPSGHSCQAYYLAKVLSKKYPDKKKQLYNIARMCDKCRVSAGIHYHSDGIFSKFLVHFLNF